jgi:hypothetical protein
MANAPSNGAILADKDELHGVCGFYHRIFQRMSIQAHEPFFGY